jgi:hypothetical protein
MTVHLSSASDLMRLRSFTRDYGVHEWIMDMQELDADEVLEALEILVFKVLSNLPCAYFSVHVKSLPVAEAVRRLDPTEVQHILLTSPHIRRVVVMNPDTGSHIVLDAGRLVTQWPV